MHRHKSTFLLLVVVLAAVGGSTVIGFRAQTQEGGRSPHKSQKMIEQESRLPIGDYAATEPDDPKEKERREAKAKKYARTDLSVDPYSDVVTTSNHWAAGLSAIPVEQITLVTVGTVSKAKAELTPNHKKVYSEFTVIVNEVIKNNAASPVSSGDVIVADRAGGRVRFPSGKVGVYWVTGQGMPQVGRTYVLFLTRPDEEAGYTILTGYELRDGLVHILDDPGSGHPITASEGADVSSFLEKVRAAAVNP